MDPIWQNVAIIATVAAAAVYLVVYFVRRQKKKQRCQDCKLMKAVTDKSHPASVE